MLNDDEESIAKAYQRIRMDQGARSMPKAVWHEGTVDKIPFQVTLDYSIRDWRPGGTSMEPYSGNYASIAYVVHFPNEHSIKSLSEGKLDDFTQELKSALIKAPWIEITTDSLGPIAQYTCRVHEWHVVLDIEDDELRERIGPFVEVAQYGQLLIDTFETPALAAIRDAYKATGEAFYAQI